MFRIEDRIRFPAARTNRSAAVFTISVVVFCSTSGCVQEMADQPRYKPLAASSAFVDGAASRPQVKGTVARGQLQDDDAFFTGKSGGQLVTVIPVRALKDRTRGELLRHGQDRFDIFCSHCHGEVGGGSGGGDEMRALVGMVVQRGFPMPPTYHQPRLRDAPDGHFFDVITNGLGRMPAHGYLIPAEDRWAIVAYIRALQLSQNAPRDELANVDIEALNAKVPPSGAHQTDQ
jgi:mono/diheme cytochrome c family protein